MTRDKRIQAVIFDWAGTTVDFGCFAPLDVFIEIFRMRGIEITPQEARAPMGMHKKDHVRALLDMPRIRGAWRERYGMNPDEDDVEALYADFEPALLAILPQYCAPIEGALECCRMLRERGLRIGSTTGYTRDMMRIVEAGARAAGYAPDCCVTAEDVGSGRPKPFMIHENLRRLDVWPPSAAIKVGDTVADIREGKNAGAISVGVVVGSSVLGLSRADFDWLPHDERERRIEAAEAAFYEAGADYVLRDLTQLVPLIDRIEEADAAVPPESIARNPYVLLTPGPLTTSPAVRAALLRDLCTWDEEYNALVQSVRARLVSLATADVDAYTAVLMQGSGTFSVESVIGSALPEGGALLAVTNGAYGDRIAQIACALHIPVIVQDHGEVGAPDARRLDRTLAAHPEITHVAVVHCETTTGIVNDIAGLGRVAKGHGKTYIVDAMSSFGGMPMDVSELSIDFLISSANKCIQGVPGFGFVIARRDALAACEGRARSLSLDLYDQWAHMEKGHGKWRYTSPTHAVRAFDRALTELEEEGGVAARHARYARNQARLAQGMAALGFEALLPPALQSPIITAFRYPTEGAFSFDALYRALKAEGFVIYPGKISQADTFRIGNIGEVYPRTIEALLRAVAGFVADTRRATREREIERAG